MQMRLPAAVLAIAALALPAHAQTPDADDPRAAARAFEAAQAKGDGAALQRLLARDFLFVRGSGRVGNRQDYVEGFTGPGDSVSALEVTDRLFTRVAPDAAVAGGEARIAGTEGGQPFQNHYRFSNVLVRRDGRWQIIFSQVTGLAR